MSDSEFSEMLVANNNYLQPYALTLTRDNESARDLLQETMYRALANKEKYHTGTNIKAWTYTIMRNIFINDYRRKSKNPIVPDNTENEVLLNGARNLVNNNAEANLGLKDIQAAIRRLPEIFRHPFVLYYEGYHYDEIAYALTVPMGTVKSRIHFSRKILRHELETG